MGLPAQLNCNDWPVHVQILLELDWAFSFSFWLDDMPHRRLVGSSELRPASRADVPAKFWTAGVGWDRGPATCQDVPLSGMFHAAMKRPVYRPGIPGLSGIPGL